MQLFIRYSQSAAMALAVLAGLLIISQGGSQAEEGCGPMVENKCSSCHFVTHICAKIDQGKGSFYWKRIIENMVISGMVATDKEQGQLVQCLASPDTKVRALCPKP
nr:hypothetical protein [uncultured Desulfobulbus sp.]